MSKDKSYLGITIGPIYKTINKAEKTRELWAASYLFSYLCKKLMLGLRSNQNGFSIRDDQFLLPSPQLLAAKSKPGVGLYPDRILIRVEKGDILKIKNTIKSVKTAFIDELLEGISRYQGNDSFRLFKQEILDPGKKNIYNQLPAQYLMEYFQVYSLEIEAKHLQLKNPNGFSLGLVKSLNLYLDHLELRPSLAVFDPDPIKFFLRAVHHTFLLQDAFSSSVTHFSSLIEIATVELRFLSQAQFQRNYDTLCRRSLSEAIQEERTNLLKQRALIDDPLIQETKIEENFEDDLMAQLFGMDGVQNFLRTYHKYVAIVHGDGDKMGQLIGSLSEAEIPGFSNDLLAFAQEANNLIAGKKYTEGDDFDWGYGGAPIFIGGDDLVFFAPVGSRDGSGNFKTIFHHIKEIDDCFDQIFNEKDEHGQFKKYPNISERPRMTYGVSITYIKHPMKEAYSLSRELMEQIKHNTKYHTRNRLHFKILKHSGQDFDGIIDKNNSTLFMHFLQMLEITGTPTPEGTKAENFITSITYKLDLLKIPLRCCFEEKDRILAKGMLTAFFKNEFNEPIHEEYKDYLQEVLELAWLALGQNFPIDPGNPDHLNDYKEYLTTLHGMLRFIHFIRDNEFRT